MKITGCTKKGCSTCWLNTTDRESGKKKMLQVSAPWYSCSFGKHDWPFCKGKSWNCANPRDNQNAPSWQYYKHDCWVSIILLLKILQAFPPNCWRYWHFAFSKCSRVGKPTLFWTNVQSLLLGNIISKLINHMLHKLYFPLG